MNKKGLSDFWITIIIVVLVIIAIFIVYATVYNYINSVSPKFNITKEECHNEINCNYLCNENPSIYSAIDCFFDYVGINNETCYKIEYYEKECEQFEVDEISFWKECDSSCDLNVRDCNINNESDCIYKNEVLKTISKQDLTTEWLNENCKCDIDDYLDKHKGYCNDGYSQRCIGVLVDLEYLLENCTKYKCGDYTVEVLR